MTSTLHIKIFGVPAPKGSTRAFVVRKKGETGPGRAVIVPDNKAPAKLWAGAVQEAASRAVQEQRQGQPILGPVRVRVTFHLPRPKSLKRGVLEHTKKPDADKLARNVGDALRHVAYEDDASVVEWAIRKCYAVEAPHADIIVEAVDGPLLEKPGWRDLPPGPLTTSAQRLFSE